MCYKQFQPYIIRTLYTTIVLSADSARQTVLPRHQRRATADEGRLRTGNEGDEYAAAGVNGGVPGFSSGGL